MKQPKVSFIIPYFNSGLTIDETISSIQNQSYKHYDIWLINDGSTDAFSINKLEELKNIEKITILHIPNSGPGIARNIAIEKTDAELIVPLDADDIICKNSILQGIEILINNSEIGIVYGDFLYFGERSDLVTQTEKFSLPRQLVMNQVAVTALIRKKVFIEIGYYDEYLSKPGLEDWEFWIRVGQSNWVFKKIQTVFFHARCNNLSRTFQVANQNLSLIHNYVYKKHMNVLLNEYKNLFYSNKQILETPDFLIGKFVMYPYRKIKLLMKKYLNY